MIRAMKKRIVKFLLWLASKLSSDVETVNGYEAKKLGISFCIASSEISRRRQSLGKSYKDAQADAINDMKKRIRQSIYGSLIDGKHIEYEVSKRDGDIIVGGYIRIYKRK